MVSIMRRAGLSDQQVLELGTDLRNTLASAGAAQIVCDKKVEAILVVDGDRIRAATRQRGSFVYNVKRNSGDTIRNSEAPNQRSTGTSPVGAVECQMQNAK